VQWAVVSELEPNARRSRSLQDYADVVTKHVCTNRICSQSWYECDHSCGKNSTRHTRFSHPYVLRRHMNRYHKNSNNNTVPTSCRNVTMLEEPSDDTCMQYDESSVADGPQSTDAPTVTTGITLETIVPEIENALGGPASGLATTGTSHSFESDSLNNHHRNCVRHGYYNAAVQLVARASFQDKTRQGMGCSMRNSKVRRANQD
jgi:hypothetical protein